MYAPEKYEKKKEFDSAQRQHQNFLEKVMFVNMSVLVSGFHFPMMAAMCGAIWSVGRVMYSYGYAKTGPKGRMVGAMVATVPQILLMGMTFYTGYKLI